VSRITIDKIGPAGEIRLNRPEVLNAMGRDWPADMLAAAAVLVSEEHLAARRVWRDRREQRLRDGKTRQGESTRS
jgi:enoyl-CoA hydratase/carnithine racemase